MEYGQRSGTGCGVAVGSRNTAIWLWNIHVFTVVEHILLPVEHG